MTPKQAADITNAIDVLITARIEAFVSISNKGFPYVDLSEVKKARANLDILLEGLVPAEALPPAQSIAGKDDWPNGKGVVIAALAWFGSLRKPGYTAEQQLIYPTGGCTTHREEDLAIAVAAYLKESKT